ncbi:MAG: molecular chaperone TorD family protein [Candidatus Thiodiazotropha sp. (ex. Lucinoma kazani)]
MGKQTKKLERAPIKVLKAFYQAVADDMEMLVLLHDKEPDGILLQALREGDFPNGLGLKLLGSAGLQALDLMRRSLAALPASIDETVIDELAADYADIYLNYSIQSSPEESVWIDEESLACQDSMFQVRAWYEQYGLMAENWRVRPDDHLVLQLQFLSHLFAVAESESDLEEAARFMDEHLLRWLGLFTQRVSSRCETPYFAGIALLTGAYCEELRDLMVTILDQPRPSEEEIEDRMKPTKQLEEVPVSFMPGMGPAV